jgi:hypothetical protein
VCKLIEVIEAVVDPPQTGITDLVSLSLAIQPLTGMFQSGRPTRKTDSIVS